VGLTNSPNLDLPALNSQDHTMKLTAEQLTALGLAADATDEQIAAKIVAVVQAQPKGVAPELGSVLSKIQDTLAGLVAAKGSTGAAVAAVAGNATAEPSEAHSIAVNAVVDAAITAGKVAPGSKAAFVKQGGTTLESLKLLQELIASLPVLVATNAGGLGTGGGGNGGSGASKLTPEQQAICKDLGVSEAEFLKSRSELTS
jgi:phage I-like protein